MKHIQTLTLDISSEEEYQAAIHNYLEAKLRDFDAADATQEEVAKFLADFGYFPIT